MYMSCVHVIVIVLHYGSILFCMFFFLYLSIYGVNDEKSLISRTLKRGGYIKREKGGGTLLNPPRFNELKKSIRFDLGTGFAKKKGSKLKI